MSAYRYWRINLSTANSNGRIWLRDLELRGVIGGPDLTVPGGAFTVNCQDSTEVGLRAIDGNPTTAWNSGDSPTAPMRVAQGTYDFGAPTEIVEVAFLFTDEHVAPSAGSWVSASNDLVNWAVFSPSFGVGQNLTLNTLSAIPLLFSSPTSPAGNVAGKTSRLSTSWPAGGATRSPPSQARYGSDVGRYRIDGNVYIDGTPDVPVSRRVRLFDRQAARLIRETWSNAATGSYSFENLPLMPDGYFMISSDHTGVFNAEVKDRIQPIL